MENKFVTALSQELVCCRECHKLIQKNTSLALYCPRCKSPVYPRIPHSLVQSWAFLLTGILLYIPANLLPIMTLSKVTATRTDTIMSGVINLLKIDMTAIAILVFIASIIVPLLKMLALLMILLAVHFKWGRSAMLNTRMARMIEFIGRWSMLDIFVMSILLGIVKFNKMASVDIEPAAVIFAMVVVSTMLAALRFDSRLLWDDIHEHR